MLLLIHFALAQSIIEDGVVCMNLMTHTERYATLPILTFKEPYIQETSDTAMNRQNSYSYKYNDEGFRIGELYWGDNAYILSILTPIISNGIERNDWYARVYKTQTHVLFSDPDLPSTAYKDVYEADDIIISYVYEWSNNEPNFLIINYTGPFVTGPFYYIRSGQCASVLGKGCNPCTADEIPIIKTP